MPVSRIRLPLAVAVAPLMLGGCITQEVEAHAPGDSIMIHEFIVRYVGDPPETTIYGQPWGVQCLQVEFRNALRPGIWLGGGMRVLKLQRPIPVNEAMSLAADLGTCVHVDWAEPDLTRTS